MPQSLPFSISLDRSNPNALQAAQLRLAMFRRANPSVAWIPKNFGAAGSRDVDNVLGTRSWDAMQSYMDFRFGPGVVTTYKDRPGIPHSLVLPQVLSMLEKDTPYVAVDSLAVPYYTQIQTGKGSVPLLPSARPGLISLACSASSSDVFAGFGDDLAVRGLGQPASPLDPFTQAAASAMAPVVASSIQAALPSIQAGIESSIEAAANKSMNRALTNIAIGGGVVAAGLAALIVFRTAKS